MMTEELEMIEDYHSLFKIGGVTYIAFLVVGLIPLSVYLIDYLIPINSDSFLWTILCTAFGFILLDF